MDTPPVTTPPTSVILPGSPDHLATLEGSRNDVGSASGVPSPTVEPADMLATPEEKTDVANDTHDCAAVELPDSIVNSEHTENEPDKAENRGSNDKSESPVCAPEVSIMVLVGEDPALQATCDAVKPSAANWVHDLDPPDDRVDNVNHKSSVVKLRDSLVEPEDNVKEGDEVGGFASTIQPADRDFKAEISESENKLLTNNSSTDKSDSTGASQEDSAVGPGDRLGVKGCGRAEKCDDSERSSISRIVDYLFAIGTSITGASHAASEDNHDVSTDDHVFPIVTQQISPSFAESPIILGTTDDEVHQAEVDTSTTTCKGPLSTASEICGNGTGDKSNASSSVQPIHGIVTPGPIKEGSSDPSNEFPTGQSADNSVVPEIVEHKKTPDNTNGEPFTVVSTNVLAIPESSGMPVDSSDGYSTDRAGLEPVKDDEDRRLLAASPDSLAPSSTISSQAKDSQELEDELEEREICEDTIIDSTDRAGLDTAKDGEDRRLLAASPDPLTHSSNISSQVEDSQGLEDELEEGEICEDTIIDSTVRAGLNTAKDDEDRRLLAASPDPLTHSSTISSQAGDSQGLEDELEEGEIREDTITVFHDAVRFNVKHPLINKWTLWYTKPSSGKHGENWSDLLKEIQTFDSVEEFWAIYVHGPSPQVYPSLTPILTPYKEQCSPPSALANKSDYQLFKFGIRPEWEDPANKRGGRFSFTFHKGSNIDTQWLDVLLVTIGETLEPEGVSEVQGVVANIRKGFTRISCWTRTTGLGRTDRDRLMALGRHFKVTLGLTNGENLDFSEHDESAYVGSSARARASFSV
ncbi:hypothetical protein B9Z19DRAFT_1068790 [Tuber borchii]|uniref:Translation initiation factor eIF 4e-like domain-containing protein n=1 Tax=Tuber borchii TaxID=42251 RepID=A0A2T6ZDU6_TUBBO|nr:hypothetical protein B9Z19DRAFT_1068790 [Tuber borchii]